MKTEYAERDIVNQKHYLKHATAIVHGKFGVHTNFAIAAELAHRDEVIESLQSQLAEANKVIDRMGEIAGLMGNMPNQSYNQGFNDCVKLIKEALPPAPKEIG